MLSVDVNRSSGNATPSGLASVMLLSDGTALSTFQVPVGNVAASLDTN